jgi:hypothetical protein
VEDDLFDVFRNERPSLVWVGCADSMQAALELIRSKAAGPEEQFIVYGVVTHDKVYLRAGDCSSENQDSLPVTRIGKVRLDQP